MTALRPPSYQMRGVIAQAMPQYCREMATKQMGHPVRNPKGVWGFQAYAASVLVDGATASTSSFFLAPLARPMLADVSILPRRLLSHIALSEDLSQDWDHLDYEK